MSHVLGYSEKYYFMHAIQIKHTVHRVHRGEGFDLLLSHVLGYSEKYCLLHAIQTKHTVHRVHRREGKERVQNVVLQS